MYTYIYIHICNHGNNVPFRLPLQWLCGDLCTWAHDVRFCTSCVQVRELSQSRCGDNREGIGHIVFMIAYILRPSCFYEI